MKSKEFDIEELREAVLLSDSKVWGIVSRQKGAGKTYIAKKLAECLENAGKKVLYLGFEDKEADSISLESEMDGVSRDAGNTDEMSSKKVFLSDYTQIEKAVYSENFESLIEKYKKVYDYIIVDIISLEQNSIAKKICSMCDDNMFVITKDAEDGVKLHKTIQQLLDANISICGIVMNEYRKKRSWLRM